MRTHGACSGLPRPTTVATSVLDSGALLARYDSPSPVKWQGYGEEEDTWEEADGLPADLRDAYDAAVRTSTRPMRSRRAGCGMSELCH